MLLYAKQPVYYLLKHHPEYIKTLYLAKDIDKKEYSKLLKYGFELKRIPIQAADKMAKGSNHQGFLAEVDDIAMSDYKNMLDFDFVVVLAGVSDIGNIGSIIRSAYALGVDGVIATNVKKLPLDAIARVSTGALFDTPFAIEQNIYNVLNDFKTSGFELFGADMGGIDIKKAVIPKKRVLVLGSEGEGLSKRVVSKLDTVVSIKMAHQFDSLNVAVAGAILIDRMRYE
jgi:23S rRNA (guanosine2251-2'-O)-methyltransferase